jgi:hypothetical protein
MNLAVQSLEILNDYGSSVDERQMMLFKPLRKAADSFGGEAQVICDVVTGHAQTKFSA